ncbi:transaldolase family protein [Limosilactobacillus sp.]|uniref:transaldolase family protein n=1 Tax=Limosilactobacillus sp. TaxID=2773925 RepID=UPI00345EB7A4
MQDLKIKVFSDGAVLDDMKKMAKHDYLKGFTTNPSLMKRAGIKNYMDFATEAVKDFPNYSISFEVFSTDPDTMLKEAHKITALGDNVFVKVPVCNEKGELNTKVISSLSHEGIKVNVTAIATADEVKAATEAVDPNVPSYMSIFVGRVADAGNEWVDFVKKSVEYAHKLPKCEVLWASTREVANIFDAQKMGVDIITVPPAILEKFNAKRGQTPMEISKNTVDGFNKDIKQLGFSILD